ncbi:uncharacterized protein LOC112341018 [Selaginella moellendorffii]|uniref:uncharacterized protein LOC112341018 n=1 Tax=Selaginella moellendorffii TaxID=88036 RepID=UPI000D1C9601|nr:uncharacterized protein LOC112341018 [Selaginella moellendorffii]|eukprot:XP_024516136.1 uncharacterized protein LOC112341018 [Selaginella moellendorffii]
MQACLGLSLNQAAWMHRRARATEATALGSICSSRLSSAVPSLSCATAGLKPSPAMEWGAENVPLRGHHVVHVPSARGSSWTLRSCIGQGFVWGGFCCRAFSQAEPPDCKF